MRVISGIVAATVMTALAACTPASDPPPTAEPTASAVTPTISPTPSVEVTTLSPTPTPSPTQTLDADQTAARDVVLEYYDLMNKYGMDVTLLDMNPIVNITSGDAQLLALTALDGYRQKNAVQTHPVVVSILGVGTGMVDASGSRMVTVDACVDSSSADLVSVETGSSLLGTDRSPINIFSWDVVQNEDGWLLNDVEVVAAKGCA